MYLQKKENSSLPIGAFFFFFFFWFLFIFETGAYSEVQAGPKLSCNFPALAFSSATMHGLKGFFCLVLGFFGGSGVELRATWFLGRCSTT
jgi:hypothetical protein